MDSLLTRAERTHRDFATRQARVMLVGIEDYDAENLTLTRLSGLARALISSHTAKPPLLVDAGLPREPFHRPVPRRTAISARAGILLATIAITDKMAF